MSCYETLSIVAQFSILGVTVIYAFFAGVQWWTIRQQGQRADKNLQIAERAYLNVSPSPPVGETPQDPGNIVEVKIQTMGKPPLLL